MAFGEFNECVEVLSFTRPQKSVRSKEFHIGDLRQLTAGALRRAEINDKPAPAETRTSVLSILGILMPREKRALLASSNLSRPVRLDRGG
jgi:hypothetical protein